MLMIDIDFFKHINGTYGHQTGDSVLKTIATIIAKNIREIDIAGRYGGEKYIVLLPEATSAIASEIAEHI